MRSLVFGFFMIFSVLSAPAANATDISLDAPGTTVQLEVTAKLGLFWEPSLFEKSICTHAASPHTVILNWPGLSETTAEYQLVTEFHALDKIDDSLIQIALTQTAFYNGNEVLEKASSHSLTVTPDQPASVTFRDFRGGQIRKATLTFSFPKDGTSPDEPCTE